MELTHRRTGAPVQCHQDGATQVFLVEEGATYKLTGSGIAPKMAPPYVALVDQSPGHWVAEVCFDNYVGRAKFDSICFDVRHRKLQTAAFERMLEDVTRSAATLAFGFDAPTSRAFEDAPLEPSSIPFHALTYLRHVMLKEGGGESVLGQFLQLARHPHRRTQFDVTWRPVHDVDTFDAGSLEAIPANPEHLVMLQPDHPLLATSLGGQLVARGVPSFPAMALTQRRDETFDTHENRLVKSFLSDARELLVGFENHVFVHPDRGDELKRMREELDWMASFDFLSAVGPLKVLPASSTVLQRSAGYKELFGHWLMLRTGARLGSSALWERLLDLKDCATLYELWCFFAVKRELESALAVSPELVDIEQDQTQSRVPFSARVAYFGGTVELLYNQTYPGRKTGDADDATSYSVRLRPDVVVRLKTPEGHRALVLDAKYKFDGDRWKEDEKQGTGPAPAVDGSEAQAQQEADEEPIRKALAADLHKMHAYRDALRDVVGAFVLFPGNHARTYREKATSAKWEGIGAMPLVPGAEPVKLKEVLRAFLASRLTAPL